jgi:hypothetical protein
VLLATGVLSGPLDWLSYHIANFLFGLFGLN